MSFDVSNMLGVLMEYTNRIFQPYLDQRGVVFIGDILVYSKTNEDHSNHLRVVLQTLRQKKLYVKLSKCELWLDEMSFLGNVISSGGISVDLLKVNVVLQWETPKPVT